MAETLDKKELNKLRTKILRDNAPSSRQQSYHFIYWQAIGDTLGQPFDATKIPISKLYQMRRDPMIAFALHFIKVPLIRAPWWIQCEDAQIAAFIDYALRRIYARLILQYTNSLDFGFQAIVKRFELDTPNTKYIDPSDPDEVRKDVWDEGNIQAAVWKTFVALPPEKVEPIWTDTGEFDGIRYDAKADNNLAFPFQIDNRDDTKNVPLELSLWVTNEKDSVFGSPWGYPRVGYSFRYWWSYWYRWALADRHFEKDADPPAIVRYPDDPNDEVVDENGNSIDYREIALGIGEQMRSGSTIAMPSNLQTTLDDRFSGIPEWDIKFVENAGNFDTFDKSFDRLEILKLRSIWVPEQAFLEGRGGTSSRNVAETLGDSFQESQAVLMAEFDDHLNQYIIPQLVKVNFPEFDGEVKKVTGGFGQEDADLAKTLVQIIGQRNPEDVPVDLKKVLERHGVPTLSAEALRIKKEQIAKDAAAMAPPPGMPPVPGEQAGTTEQSDTGFVEYIQPRESIKLSSDDFISKLPDSRHYKDREVIAATRQNREFWATAFERVYEEFAEFSSSINLDIDYPEDRLLYLDANLVPNKPGVENWVEKVGHLPKFIGDIAGDLITEKGFTVSHAIATAVNQVKKWAAGLGGVTPKTRAKAAKALAEWESKKARAHALGIEYEEAEWLLSLAEEDDADRKAKRIVDRFTVRFGGAKRKVKDVLNKVMRRAGSIELRRAKVLRYDDWMPDESDAANWAEEHSAQLVEGVSATVKNELRRFIAGEIREGRERDLGIAIRDKFAFYPQWKADRIARTETVMAYNFATLTAAKDKGFKKVQALDALKGPTDDYCEKRNGKIFSLADAFTETINEHPNGTLQWRILKTANLSIEKVDNEKDGKLAWYEPESETIFMDRDIAPEKEEAYLLILGEMLNDEAQEED